MSIYLWTKQHLTHHKWLKTLSFWHIWLPNVLRATTACTFSTSQLPKVARACGNFKIFTQNAREHDRCVGTCGRHVIFSDSISQWKRCNCHNIKQLDQDGTSHRNELANLESNENHVFYEVYDVEYEGVLLRGLDRYGTVGTGFGAGTWICRYIWYAPKVGTVCWVHGWVPYRPYSYRTYSIPYPQAYPHQNPYQPSSITLEIS